MVTAPLELDEKPKCSKLLDTRADVAAAQAALLEATAAAEAAIERWRGGTGSRAEAEAAVLIMADATSAHVEAAIASA